jgi:rhamnosyltransferase
VKISAVVVTYNPVSEHLENIFRLGSQFDKVYVVDNSTEKTDLLTKLLHNSKFELINLNGNLGIAKALNVGLSKACLEYDYCVTFDQDSKLKVDFSSEMKKRLNYVDSNTAILAPNFFDRNSKSYATFSLLTKWQCKNFNANPNIKKLLPSSFAITSGAFINLNIYMKIGPFKDEYFIDHVDSEYCLRAKRNGYKIFIAQDVVLNHSIGERTKHNLLGLTIKPNHHNAQRKYFICRNGISMSKEYFNDYPSYSFLTFARLVHEVIAIVFFEKNKLNKSKAMLFGFYDAIKGTFNNEFRF